MSDALIVVLACVLAAGFAYALLGFRGQPKRVLPPPPPGAEIAYTALIGRMEELEDKYNRLDRRFTRLQGEFSALTRFQVDEELDEDDSPRA